MKYLLPVLIFVAMASADQSGLNVDALGGASKKFFMDMTKKVMGVPSLKPENLAAQAFFREFLDKYTKLDDKVKKDMMQHVPTATKIFNAAAAKFNVDPAQAFKVLSTFFINFKEGAAGGLAKEGMKTFGKILGKSN